MLPHFCIVAFAKTFRMQSPRLMLAVCSTCACSLLAQRLPRLSTVAPLWHCRLQSCLSLRELQRMT